MNKCDKYSMFNECSITNAINALNHYFIDYSLSIEHCPLNIGCKEGIYGLINSAI
jgi:hypothetical protein